MASSRPRGRLDRLLDVLQVGNWPAYPDLGAKAAAIRRGHEATVRPSFYRELGRDVGYGDRGGYHRTVPLRPGP